MFTLESINTSILKKDFPVRITIYYKNHDRALTKFNELIEGYHTEKIIRIRKHREAVIIKDGHPFIITMLYANEGARGYQTNYAYIDANLFKLDRGVDVFENVIKRNIVDDNVSLYHAGVKEERIYKY